MKVAVISMTRERLAYTAISFASLEMNAGIDYDHYVLDNGSQDGTVGWLGEWMRMGKKGRHIFFSKKNLGICTAANRLLDVLDPAKYDVIVRFDNDCEVTQSSTLKATAELAADYGAIVAPRVLGLLNPPPTIRTVSLGGQLVDETAILGGIFMAIPAMLFDEFGFRYDENQPLASGDEAIVPWWRAQGGTCGYLQGYEVNHYDTTEGQKKRFPDYEARKVEEMAV